MPRRRVLWSPLRLVTPAPPEKKIIVLSSYCMGAGSQDSHRERSFATTAEHDLMIALCRPRVAEAGS